MKLFRISDSYSSVRERVAGDDEDRIRGFKVEPKGYVRVLDFTASMYEVTSPKGDKCVVKLRADGRYQTCTCWAFKKGNGKPCKHIDLVKVYIS